MKIMNLTPHVITFVSADQQHKYPIEPSGIVARVSVKTERIGSITTDDGFEIPITTSVFGQVEHLPEPEVDTVFVVSSLVANRVDRNDVFIPNESVRNEKGQIVGCLSLGKI